MGLKYIGDGSVWKVGRVLVPPRDLTDAEVDHYGGGRALVASGLYESLEVKDGNIISDKEDAAGT